MSVFKPILFICLAFAINKVSGQQMPDTLNLVLKSKFELGFTPRFSGIKDFVVSPSDSGYCYSTAWYRFQAGVEFSESQYLHLLIDYFRIRTDLNFLDKSINAFGIGIQYSLKFEEALVSMPPFRLYKKAINIRWFPELSFAIGTVNLRNNNYILSGLEQTKVYYLYGQYGIAWNFYFNNWGHISILYLQEYTPSFSHNPYRYFPLQVKLVIKL